MEGDLAALAAYLADPNVRLVTILGLGGMGKTRLALAAAAAQLNGPAPASRFSHGVIFVSLARLETPDQLVPAIAEAVNLRFQSGSDPKTQLLDYLRQKAMLLVLDNFEHLRGQAGLVNEILRAGAKIKVLVTSREKLNLQAEQLFPIGGLQLPAPDQATDGPANRPLSQYSAIQLFCERARRVRPDFALTACESGLRRRHLSPGAGHAAGHCPGGRLAGDIFPPGHCRRDPREPGLPDQRDG